jgi:dTMP kinase
MLFVEAVLRWAAIGLALVRSRLTRRIAVMDRYAACQYASIRAHARSRARWAERLARAFYQIFPAPDVTFLLAVPPPEAYRRIDVRGTDHERLEFLAAAAEAYEQLPEAPTFVRVDADAPPEDVTRAIHQHLTASLIAN